jgi:hypothetical protein
MEPGDWKKVDFFGLLLGFMLCIAGFYQMNYRLLIYHRSSTPPLSHQYEGAMLFVLGIISFILLENGRKYNQGKYEVVSKITFLIIISFMAVLSLMIFSRSYILI